MAAKKSWMKGMVRRWRRRLIIGGAVVAGLVVVTILVTSLAGKDIRLWWTLRGIDDDTRGTIEEVKRLGRPYRDALGRAVLGGGREFQHQLELCWLLHDRPFHGQDILREALSEDDPAVRRAAAVVLMNRGGLEGVAKPIPDHLFEVLKEWCGHPAHPWLRVGLVHAAGYHDPRLVDLLLPVLRVRSQDVSKELLGIGRANKNREQVATVLKRYLDDPRVEEVFAEVVKRDGESDMVQFQVWRAMASRGYAKDPSIYWVAAKSTNDFVRQTVAEHLELVASPEVIPILEYLLADRKDVVRRGALDSLIKKKSPIVLRDIWYVAEDSYSSLKGDLATAVGILRSREHIPYLVWCLDDADPIVVEKTLVELYRLTKEHHGFSKEQWDTYQWNRPLAAGVTGRPAVVKAFMEDRARKRRAFASWAESYPPLYRDEDRVPHLIRQLGHEDNGNVKRAMKELDRITGRRDGFPGFVFERAPDQIKAADEMVLFRRRSDQVIADWEAWLPEWEKQVEEQRKREAEENREPPEDEPKDPGERLKDEPDKEPEKEPEDEGDLPPDDADDPDDPDDGG